MEEEQPEVQELTLEEQLAPENVKPTKLNKNGKPRKVLTQESLDKLARARAKANAMRQQNYTKKLEEKVEKLKQKPVINEEVVTPEIPQPESQPDPAEVEIIKEKPKPKGKKKTKIIVEQSSDDSDEFEPNDSVVFVKRVSRKKKEPVKEPELERQPAMEMPPPEPDPPPEPKTRLMTPHQMMMRDSYNNMFSGNFLNQNGMRRRY